VAERQRVLDLHVEGLNQVEIGQRLGVHKSTVCRDLGLLKMAWRLRIAAASGTTEGRQLAQVRNMLQATWGAWRVSGDAAYLGVMRWCLDREAKLLGLSVSPVWLLEQEVALALEQGRADPAEGL
jgi:hypothetical protein